MNYPHVSIIILNWNNWKDTIECLESVYQIDYSNYNTIVVDNGSENDSIDNIKEYCKGNLEIISNFFDYNYNNKPINILEIKNMENEFDYLNHVKSDNELILIMNDKNYGYTEGNNIGVRFALNQFNSDYILILNNDTVLNNKSLKKMVMMSEKDEKIALTQPKLLYYDKPNIINSTGNKMDLFGYTCCRGIDELDTGKYDKCTHDGFFYVSGACILIKSDFLSEFNGQLFDSILFAYHEDVDISFSAHILGYKLIYCPEAICYHKERMSLNDGIKRSYWVQRNNLRVLLKNYSIKYLILIFPTTLILELLFAMIYAINQKQLEYLTEYPKSIFWNIKHIGDTRKKRRIIQSKRKINDRDLFKFMEKKSLKISINYQYFLHKFFKN